MAANKNAEREARDRLRRYTARQAVHTHQVTRRKRDNVWAIVGVVVVVALATLTQVFFFTAGPGLAKPTPSASPTAQGSEQNVGSVPAKTIAEGRTWTGDLALNGIRLGISLDGAKAPQAVSAIISLAKANFYTTTGATCHRLTSSATAKLIQCGSADGKGAGDPGFSFGPLENVPADGVYPAGTIAMARSATQYSQGSQFFITYAATTLDPSTGGYSIIGTVTSGLDSFIAQIAAKGVTGGGADGTPVVATKITDFAVQ